ncbi:interferon-induced GTP-binding protein Mx3-like [Heptranchias perlo]|uniref:interferon-induced GTP-binding protein Mx3-like n=1 Tax=Heptranchias perlo TaxID=212740 RepID=UPI00355AA0EF
MSDFCNRYEDKARTYIDVIDNLRSMGIDKEFALPTITVIGDQSSGKSSVLEMISEVNLPRGTGVVTRCPLELKLKRAEVGKPWKGRISYRNFVKTLDHSNQVEEEILKAQDILVEDISVSSELISLQIESTSTPDLTLIDMPGIIRVPTGNQPQDIGDMTKKLIKTYIQRKETIILVVIPCTVDIATTEALKMAQEVDPEGERTLGVLTKPDLIDRGTEEDIIRIIENKTVPLKKGYMLVKCRGQSELNANTTMPAALEEEIRFLNSSRLFRPLLDKGLASFNHLSDKLTTELIQQIVNWLPNIEEALREKIIDTTKQLEKLGRDIPEEDQAKTLTLCRKILIYCDELINLVMGDYTKEYQYDKKLCDIARVAFATWYNKLELEKLRLSEEAIRKVRHHEKYSKGRELPEFTKYRVFEAIVREQIQELLEPSLQILKELSDKVQAVFVIMAFEHFNAFPNLMGATKALVAQIRQKQEQEAEQMLRMHFKMEHMVYAPDAMYSHKLKKLQSGDEKISQGDINSSSGNSNQTMATQLKVYYQIAIDRLVQIVPMVTKYHLLQEFANQVKLQMTQTFLNGADHGDLLEEEYEIAKKRQTIKDSLKQLTKARTLLMSKAIERLR